MMMSRGEYVRIISIWTWLTRDLKVVEVGRYHKNVQNVFDILSLYQIKRFLYYVLRDEYRMISIIREKNVKKCSSLMFCILIARLEYGHDTFILFYCFSKLWFSSFWSSKSFKEIFVIRKLILSLCYPTYNKKKFIISFPLKSGSNRYNAILRPLEKKFDYYIEDIYINILFLKIFVIHFMSRWIFTLNEHTMRALGYMQIILWHQVSSGLDIPRE